MKVALIGGAGFVGHHLALALKARGDEPIVYDSLTVNNFCSLVEKSEGRWPREWTNMTVERINLLHDNKIPLIHCDARDYHRLSIELAARRPDSIVHLAAVAHIDRSNKDPQTTFDHSLRTLENALDVGRAIGAGRFLYFSSSTAYGPFQSPEIDETHPLQPQGVYGSLKAAGEYIVRAYQTAYGLPCTIIRPQALYGPRCVSGRVIQKFIETALDQGVIRIEGDGSAVHDFTEISDLVDGILLVLDNPKAANETFNITTGQARSLMALALTVTFHVPCQVEKGPENPEKPSRGTMKIDKAKQLLGYEPKWTLEDGVERYIQWYRDFLA